LLLGKSHVAPLQEFLMADDVKSMPPAPPSGYSLEEVNRSVKIPSVHWWRRLAAFAGPAYMVSVGYMDPGNWATDIQGGSSYGYKLMWVLLMSNAMAVLLQTLAARLGVVTGHDLAQACREEYPTPVRYTLFGLCELAIVATDLAELLGSAVGINLLFGINIVWAVVITGFDVLVLLVIQRFGIRKMEAFIVMLISTIGLCFVVEVFLSKPDPAGIISGFIPGKMDLTQLTVALGILGATVMPHNLYLHSSLVQSRDIARDRTSVRQACKYNLIDSLVAMNGAFFINAAILIVAAAVFTNNPVSELGDAYQLLGNLLGSRAAQVLFAVGLICAGQSSTVTGTLAGQITMEGFIRFRMRPWVRRIVTRAMAIAPAIAVVAVSGSGGVLGLMILSQVVLTVLLPFAIIPLVKFTNSKQKMGPFASSTWVKALAWITTATIFGLNSVMIGGMIGDWLGAGGWLMWLTICAVLPASAGYLALLTWMTIRREKTARDRVPISADHVANEVSQLVPRFRRIGVALEAKPADAAVIAEAVALARANKAELVLMHVVEGVGGQWYGPQTGDIESREDETYLTNLAKRLKEDLAAGGVPDVRPALAYGGNVPWQLVRLARNEEVDLIVVGSHGHRALGDLIHGQTIDKVRHDLHVPIMAVR
jgi:manganese transport protein